MDELSPTHLLLLRASADLTRKVRAAVNVELTKRLLDLLGDLPGDEEFAACATEVTGPGGVVEYRWKGTLLLRVHPIKFGEGHSASIKIEPVA